MSGRPVAAAACKAGWSERRRSSRNQTMQGASDRSAIKQSTHLEQVGSPQSCNPAHAQPYYMMWRREKREDVLQRYAVLYLATLIVLIPADFLFLGTIAKAFFTT